VIDYFANMNTVAAKDKTAYINAAAYEAKQFVLHDLDNGRGGVALLSPAHGSRKGTEDAAQDEGNWKREGVYMFSELEKAADMVVALCRSAAWAVSGRAPYDGIRLKALEQYRKAGSKLNVQMVGRGDSKQGDRHA
jgi:hypothetical protein